MAEEGVFSRFVSRERTDAEKTALLAVFGGWGEEGLVIEESFILSCRKGGWLWFELREEDVK